MSLKGGKLMMPFTTKEAYITYFKKEISLRTNGSEELDSYLTSLFERFDQLIDALSKESFWEVFPELLGIDAKLVLLAELIRFDEFSVNELIRITENDYRTYFKELCGYDLKTETKPSMIFMIT